MIHYFINVGKLWEHCGFSCIIVGTLWELSQMEESSTYKTFC